MTSDQRTTPTAHTPPLSVRAVGEVLRVARRGAPLGQPDDTGLDEVEPVEVRSPPRPGTAARTASPCRACRRPGRCRGRSGPAACPRRTRARRPGELPCGSGASSSRTERLATSSSATKCSTATISSPTGWSKSRILRTCGLSRMDCVSRTSPRIAVALSLPSSRSRLSDHGDRVDVDVDDARFRHDLLGDLVHVALGRDAGADVEELASRPGSRGGAPRGGGRPGCCGRAAARPGTSSMIAFAASRSAAKLWVPPRR